MYYEHRFPRYNARRYRAPYGGIMHLDSSGKLKTDYSTAKYLDDGENGGLVMIACSAGDIIVVGQVDNRRLDRSVKTIMLIANDGSTTNLTELKATQHLMRAASQRSDAHADAIA